MRVKIDGDVGKGVEALILLGANLLEPPQGRFDQPDDLNVTPIPKKKRRRRMRRSIILTNLHKTKRRRKSGYLGVAGTP